LACRSTSSPKGKREKKRQEGAELVSKKEEKGPLHGRIKWQFFGKKGEGKSFSLPRRKEKRREKGEGSHSLPPRKARMDPRDQGGGKFGKKKGVQPVFPDCRDEKGKGKRFRHSHGKKRPLSQRITSPSSTTHGKAKGKTHRGQLLSSIGMKGKGKGKKRK